MLDYRGTVLEGGMSQTSSLTITRGEGPRYASLEVRKEQDDGESELNGHRHRLRQDLTVTGRAPAT